MSNQIRLSNAGTRYSLLAVAAVVIAALGTWCPSAAAAGRAGCAMVHVGPQIAPGTPRTSYFKLTIRPGRAVRAALFAANPERYSCGVEVFAAYGKTATNSGDTYPVVGSKRGCAGTGCWLSGLPARVNVPAGRRVRVPFTVRIPRGTRGGQYLAGVVAGPSTPSAPHRVKAGHAQVSAAVVAHVAMGVAITVPGRLEPALSIPAVKLDATPEAAVLQITERDSGNTWEHPAGSVTIVTRTRVATRGGVTGQSRSPAHGPFVQRFKIRSATVLPRDHATLPLAIGAIPHGTWPTEVDLWYDHHRKEAVWRGRVSYPEPAVDRGAGTGASGSGSGQGSDVPTWVKVVIAALAAMSLGLGMLVLILLGKRRRREAEA